MAPKILVYSFLFLFLFTNCTAANIWNAYNPTNNTNPTPDYNNYTHLFLKGGWIFHLNKIPGGIGNNVEGKYSGSQCSHSILYLVSFGDSSIEATVKEARISKISSISYEQLALLSFVYHRFCTTATGE
jgi:TRL-like protein family